MLNTIHHSNIYTLSIFNTIRNMLVDIKNGGGYCVFKNDDEIKLTNGELFHFTLSGYIDDMIDEVMVEVKGLKNSQNNENNDDWKETQTEIIRNRLSYKQLNNQDLALITKEMIFIYTIVENSTNLKNSLVLRYSWTNEKLASNYNNDD